MMGRRHAAVRAATMHLASRHRRIVQRVTERHTRKQKLGKVHSRAVVRGRQR